MRSTTRVAQLCTLVSALAIGCAGSRAPADLVPEPGDLEVYPFGAWLELETGSFRDAGFQLVEGEFIGMRNDSLFVLPLTGGPVGVPLDGRVEYARLTTRSTDAVALALWSTAGMLSTISHGFWLLISAPLWALTGYGSTVATSNDGVSVCQPLTSQCFKEALAPYARFPQGIPPGLDIATLRLQSPLPRAQGQPRVP